MLRVTGAIALVLASVMATVIFVRVKTVRVTGTLINDRSPADIFTPPSLLELETDGGRRNVFTRELAPAFPSMIDRLNNGKISVEIGASFPDLPVLCEVGMTHRWVGLGGMLFGSTEFEYAGRVYPYERSARSFFGTLILVSAAPVLLWALVTLPWLILRSRRAPRPSPRCPPASPSRC